MVDHTPDIHVRRCRDGRPLRRPHREARLDKVSPEAGRMDGERTAVDGIPHDGDAPLAPVRPGEAARDGRGDLDGAFLLSVGLGCWLVGKFATLTASRRTYWLTWTAALLIVAGGYLLFLVSALDINTALAVETSGPARPRGSTGSSGHNLRLRVSKRT